MDQDDPRLINQLMIPSIICRDFAVFILMLKPPAEKLLNLQNVSYASSATSATRGICTNVKAKNY